MTSKILQLEYLTVNKMSVTHLVFMFKLIFFAFCGAEKHVFHIFPFRTTSYILKSFRYLEVSNRGRNWNKIENNIFVRTELQLFQLDIPKFINKLMWQSSLINSVSFVFSEFSRVASWSEDKSIILVRSIFQIPKYKH